MLKLRRMRNKGISPLIATVLLIGFTITMAFFVSKWGFKITTSTLDTVEGYATQSLYCSEVAIDCNEGKLKNRGAFKIEKIIVRTFLGEGTSVDERVLTDFMPNEVNSELKLDFNEKVEIIPVIFDDQKNKDIACVDKKLVLSEGRC